MKACYELKNPRKNPYAERMKNGYTIVIDRTTDPEADLLPVRIKSHTTAMENYRRGDVVTHDDSINPGLKENI